MDAENQDDQGQDSSDPGSQEQGSFYLPQSFLNGKTCKAGDKITLEVVGTDDEGDVEVKMADYGSGDSGSGSGSMADEIKTAMQGS
jgi:hypothetical protein